ncbi:MAG: DUF192 domain-containing protein [Eubacteriales bacterium]|nr:DUF192 domain-containing protein [Eubacteriales bacterium]
MKVYRLEYKGELIGMVYLADTFITRFRGLIGRKLKKNEGLLLKPCSQVHCFFMSYPIDVIYLTKEGKVLRIDDNMKPGTIGIRIKESKSVLEMPAGSCKEKGIIAGDWLNLINVEE